MSSSVTENKSLHIAALCWTFIDRESDCSRMSSRVSSDWLPSYKSTEPGFKIFKIDRYSPDSPRI